VHLWERKLAQLPLAARCGLPIPRTLVASDFSRLTQFASEQPTVVKAVAQGFVAAEDAIESVYTHAFTGRFDDERAAGLCPTLIQERVAKIADIRLTVIGRTYFAARLDADLPDGLDWRRPGTDVRYSVTAIPPVVKAAVASMLEAMELRYGAFDFALREDGVWVFLEVNPAGEFAWIEETLGLPLRDALIDELLGLESMHGNVTS
jgi:glutathione synthase/RimK-type ligase-like ATP-grasp enzyme